MNYYEQLISEYDVFEKHEKTKLIDLRSGTGSGKFSYVDLKDYEKSPFVGFPIAQKEENERLEICFAPKTQALIIASSGKGKTQFGMSYVELLARNGEDMLLSDPKMEYFSALSLVLMSRGYVVILLNLTQTEVKTDHYNFMKHIFDMRVEQIGLEDSVKVIRKDDGSLRYLFNNCEYTSNRSLKAAIKRVRAKLDIFIERAIDDVVVSVCPMINLKEASWIFGARDLFRGILYAMAEDIEEHSGLYFRRITEETFTLETAFAIFDSLGSGGDSEYDHGYFLSRPFTSKARIYASKIILIQAKITRDGYLSTLANCLSMFRNPAFRYVSLASDVDFRKDLDGDKPLAIFVCPGDEQKCIDNQIALMMSRIYSDIMAYIRKRNNKPLKRPFNFILDEFGNIAKIEDFSRYVSTGRGRNIFFTIFLQSYSQLENVYGKADADTIRENMNLRIFFGSPEIETRKRFSEEVGYTTILSPSSYLNGNSPHVTSFYTETVRAIPVSEFSSLDGGDCIVISDNNPPILSHMRFHYKIKAYRGKSNEAYFEQSADEEFYLGDEEHTYSIFERR